MRQLVLIFVLLCFFNGHAQATDTINITDNAGLKQGYWIVFGASKQKSCYEPNQKVAEGNYKDNKKDGTWTEYFCNGKIKNQIGFKEGKPNGKGICFHQNGAVSETGTFVINKWIGEYVLYWETGKPQQIFIFNEKGKRDGLQKYYIPNGRIQVISTWINNVDYAGIEFDTLGVLKSRWLNGKAVKEDNNLSKKDKELLQSMMDIATKENKLVSPSKEPPKKKVIENNNIQDIYIDPKKVKERN